MDIRKHQTYSTKGFTLVELIVVIVILAILATIAFLSFGSQSSSARDSKRKTDLSNIASKMNIAMAQWTTVVSLVSDTSSSLTSAKIAWTWTTTSDYKAWKINFNVLWVNSADFKDADWSNEYRIWATSNAWSAFQLAATLETDTSGNPWKNALLVWNYAARNAANGNNSATVAVASWATTITLPTSAVGLFKKWDYITITGQTWTWYISNVSSDLWTITLSSWLPWTWTAIKIAIDETNWLVWSWWALASPVVNWMSACAY